MAQKRDEFPLKKIWVFVRLLCPTFLMAGRHEKKKIIKSHTLKKMDDRRISYGMNMKIFTSFAKF